VCLCISCLIAMCLCVIHHPRLGCYRWGCYRLGCYRLGSSSSVVIGWCQLRVAIVVVAASVGAVIRGGRPFGCYRLRVVPSVPVAGCHHCSIGWAVLGGGRRFSLFSVGAGCRLPSSSSQHPLGCLVLLDLLSCRRVLSVIHHRLRCLSVGLSSAKVVMKHAGSTLPTGP
jgi:hypothetical protein